MKRLFTLILTLFTVFTVSAQSADQLLRKTVSKLQKDGGITMTIDARVKIDGGTDAFDLLLKLSGTSFYASQDETTMWFDGKTMWRGNDFGDGIEEIYITEPTPEEKTRYDVIGLLGKHQGFSVSGNGTDTFTLTATNDEHSVAGIYSVTAKVDPTTYAFKTIRIVFADELGNISANVKITGYNPGQTFDKNRTILGGNLMNATVHKQSCYCQTERQDNC